MQSNLQLSVMLNNLKAYLDGLTNQQFGDFYGVTTDQTGFLFNSVVIWKKQNYKKLLESIAAMTSAPAAIILPTGADREKIGCRTKNETGIAIIVVGDFNCDGWDEGIADLADFVVECFLPTEAEPTVKLTMNGVIYEPEGWEIVDTQAQNEAIAIRIEAVDFRQDHLSRGNSSHFNPNN